LVTEPVVSAIVHAQVQLDAGPQPLTEREKELIRVAYLSGVADSKPDNMPYFKNSMKDEVCFLSPNSVI
jgi:hypothetical protein